MVVCLVHDIRSVKHHQQMYLCILVAGDQVASPARHRIVRFRFNPQQSSTVEPRPSFLQFGVIRGPVQRRPQMQSAVISKRWAQGPLWSETRIIRSHRRRMPRRKRLIQLGFPYDCCTSVDRGLNKLTLS